MDIDQDASADTSSKRRRKPRKRAKRGSKRASAAGAADEVTRKATGVVFRSQAGVNLEEYAAYLADFARSPSKLVYLDNFKTGRVCAYLETKELAQELVQDGFVVRGNLIKCKQLCANLDYPAATS